MFDLKAAARILRQAGRLMVGVPDYDAYVIHQMTQHPDAPIMSYEEFFRDRQQARYGGGVARCC
ncbi:YbdD/YjiX family protein [Phaeospirillum tilakii]|uniref:YbdD/YjiX family protein n=1 Tax=Phaeospirillum tilakii TaxID=741673 RepID=A0ABW5C895_9PROT